MAILDYSFEILGYIRVVIEVIKMTLKVFRYIKNGMLWESMASG
jgi:hypothetical protein